MSSTLMARAVFLGAPGAGKGTQAKELASGGEILHISTGDMLREEVAQGSQLGREAAQYMDAGKLVPDDVMIAMVAARIDRPDAAKAWILDGFPRTLPQAESLDQTLDAADKGLSHVVFFQVPEELLVQRLTSRWTCGGCGAIWNSMFKPPQQEGTCDLCGGPLTQRSDDRPEAVGKRLSVYGSQTEPLLGYYRTKGVLVEVDANRSPDEIQQTLREVLSKES
ncbi:MAG: adenylate kinase [Planctomycetota bacterium]